MIVVKKDLARKIIIGHRTDFIYNSYFMLFKIQELDSQSKRPGRKTQVIKLAVPFTDDTLPPQTCGHKKMYFHLLSYV